MPPGLTGGINHFAAVSLSDGRLAVWCSDFNGRLWHCWKQSTDPNAAWSNWVQFALPTAGFAAQITAAPLSDGRTQLFMIAIVNQKVGIWTCLKQSTLSSDRWTDWIEFGSSDGSALPTGFVPNQIVACRVFAKKCKLWVIERDRWNVFVSEKVNTDWHAPWSGWSSFLSRLGERVPPPPPPPPTQRVDTGELVEDTSQPAVFSGMIPVLGQRGTLLSIRNLSSQGQEGYTLVFFSGPTGARTHRVGPGITASDFSDLYDVRNPSLPLTLSAVVESLFPENVPSTIRFEFTWQPA